MAWVTSNTALDEAMAYICKHRQNDSHSPNTWPLHVNWAIHHKQEVLLHERV